METYTPLKRQNNTLFNYHWCSAKYDLSLEDTNPSLIKQNESTKPISAHLRSVWGYCHAQSFGMTVAPAKLFALKFAWKEHYDRYTDYERMHRVHCITEFPEFVQYNKLPSHYFTHCGTVAPYGVADLSQHRFI